MIDFHYWPTPNGWKVAIMLEECGLEYRLCLVNIGRGEQFEPEFLAISPNNRMPAIVDHAPASSWGVTERVDVPVGGSQASRPTASEPGLSGSDASESDSSVSVFESGAILEYLAEKTGRFLPTGRRARKAVSEWLYWQVGNLGPMAGQLSHFVNYAPGEHPYSHQRYADEYHRCLGVLERRLEGREYVVDSYSIADMAIWPWVLISKPLGQSLDEFPNVSRWRQTVKSRPAVQRGVDLGKSMRRTAPPDEAERKILFGQRGTAG